MCGFGIPKCLHLIVIERPSSTVSMLLGGSVILGARAKINNGC